MKLIDDNRPAIINKNHTSKTSTLLILDREEICEISAIKKKRRKRFYPIKTNPNLPKRV